MAKILLVDDEEYIRQYYVEELSKEGHRVSAVANGDHLLELVDLFQPDIIILDIRLNEYDGLDLLREIREIHDHLPIILCSAYDTYMEDPRSANADYYVIKSLDLSELKMIVQMALDNFAPAHLIVG